MAKKKVAKVEEPMPAPTPTKRAATQAKLELPSEEFEEVRQIAKQTGRSLVAFIRVAVRKEVRRIKEGQE